MEIRILLLFLLSKGYSAVQSPAPNNCLPKKNMYIFQCHVMSELVFSFMLKFEVKKKRESELVGFFGGVFPARTGICVSAWNCSLRFIYSLTLKSCDNAY